MTDEIERLRARVKDLEAMTDYYNEHADGAKP
jgi:hypothetical protein